MKCCSKFGPVLKKGECYGSSELASVVPRASWREIFPSQTENSVNSVSTCLKVVDTRRQTKPLR